MSQVTIVKQISLPEKPSPKVQVEDILKSWFPMGTIAPYSLDEVYSKLQEILPANLLPSFRIVTQKGPGQHRMRHFRSYTLLIEQPVAGKYRGEGKKPEDRVMGRDGLVTLSFSNGPDGFKKQRLYSVRLPRRYAEGGDLDV